jgi:outer membrane protein OmpA-like peptidoglycan-associated protein
MATNLIDVANTLLTPDVVSKASSLIGETPAKTREALGTVMPSLAGIACNEASTPGGATKLYSLISSTRLPDDLHTNLAGLLSGGAATDGLLRTGSQLISSLLGDRAGKVANVIADSAGIRFSSASTLLNLAAPLFLGVLGRHLTTSSTAASGLSSLLAGHRDTVLRSIPSGLGSALGLNQNSDICGSAPAPAVRPVAVAEPVKKGIPIWWWLLPLLLLIACFLWWRSCNAPTGPKMASITLPCGTVISVEEGYFTYNLANYMLKGSDSELPKTFVFDHLNFDSATTNLTPESKPTVTDVISIMKCYPNMNVKLEGHTDSTGDAAANKKLSMDRAEAVKALLVAGGIDAGRIDTAGWGQEKPIASNDNEEGRAKNRRTELTVVKK